MKRHRSKSPLRLSRDAEKLIALSTGLTASGSRAEDQFWEREILKLVQKLVGAGNDSTLEAALDHLFQSNSNAYDALAEMIEAGAETLRIEREGETHEALLLAIPLVAWTKYSLPSGPLSAEAVAGIVPHIHGHVLAREARFALSPFLYSIDQLPREFSSVHKLAEKLGTAAVNGATPKFDFSRLPDTAPMLADVRFLLGAVTAPSGDPFFRWQELEEKTTRTECLERWVAQARPNLAKLLPGCAFESLIPDAFFVACRESDRRVRPYTLRAGVAFLEHTLKTTASNLRAFVAGIGVERVDEYRIGFSVRGDEDVVHGVVWPLFGREDEESDPSPLAEIEAVLADCKVGEIVKHQGLFQPEFCEDCGAPLFADEDTDMVHPELPEEADGSAARYH
ncbi:MAG: DUF2863 family protein [Betaproteobacteria bacterium]|nr:DUF2863 family protein [Betaproteobacteria bacterium]